MVGVEEGREFRFHGDLYSHESTFSLVIIFLTPVSQVPGNEKNYAMQYRLTYYY